MEVEIRQATIEDLPKMAPLATALVKSQNLPFKVGGTKCVDGFVKTFLRSPDGICFIAICNDKIVGWIGAYCGDYMFSDEPICHVRAWDVHPHFRTTGIGSGLLDKIGEWARKKGVEFLSVGVNKASSDKPEIAFTKLEHQGFEELERFFIKRLT